MTMGSTERSTEFVALGHPGNDHYAGLEGCIRVSIGLPEENDAFLQAAAAIQGSNCAH